ncbi:MAG: phage minor head protein, partial [Dehalococcoidales bacterium]|nr:phage minor head protein [Dehalococcoidales bacterium]
SLTQLKTDPRVAEVRDEGEDGKWVDLKDGFINTMSETHSIHEDTWEEVIFQMNHSVEKERNNKKGKIYSTQFMLIKGVRLNGQLPFLMEWKAKVGKVSPLNRSEREFKSAMNDIFTRQAADARKNVERFVKSGGTLIDGKKWTNETNQLTLPIRWHPFKAGGDTALSAIHFDLPEWIESKQVLDAIRNENFMFAREISNGTADRLQSELLEGMDNGETITELKKRIYDIDEEWQDAGRAEMIARTESARAYSTGTTEAWKETDVVEAKVWDASADACAFCLAMDGTEVELDSNFKDLGDTMAVAGGGTMEFDYSSVGGPPLHPNCRCALTARLE